MRKNIFKEFPRATILFLFGLPLLLWGFTFEPSPDGNMPLPLILGIFLMMPMLFILWVGLVALTMELKPPSCPICGEKGSRWIPDNRCSKCDIKVADIEAKQLRESLIRN